MPHTFINKIQIMEENIMDYFCVSIGLILFGLILLLADARIIMPIISMTLSVIFLAIGLFSISGDRKFVKENNLEKIDSYVIESDDNREIKSDERHILYKNDNDEVYVFTYDYFALDTKIEKIN